MCEIVLEGGEKYIGDVKTEGPYQGQPHGKGKVTYTDGSSYEGSFENGEARSPGIVRDANSQPLNGFYAQQYLQLGHYQGDYENGKCSGYGLWVYPGTSGQREGEFVNDQMHGFIITTYSTGIKTLDTYCQHIVTDSIMAGQDELEAATIRRNMAEKRREKMAVSKKLCGERQQYMTLRFYVTESQNDQLRGFQKNQKLMDKIKRLVNILRFAMECSPVESAQE